MSLASMHAVVSLVAILMGLNLLEVLPLRLPSLDVDVRQLSAPPLLQVCTDATHAAVFNNLLAAAASALRQPHTAPRAVVPSAEQASRLHF